jgi:uncharacterized protein (DUF1501 family)
MESLNVKDWTYCDGQGGLEKKAVLPRRELVAAGLAGLVWWMGSQPALAQAAFQVKPTHDNVLVVIFLRGGADGVNMVAPYGEDSYYRIRPSIAIPKPGAGEGRLLKLDDFFGLHPSLSPLYPLYQEGEMAVIHACGSGDTTRSHFEAMSAMERGLRDDRESAGGGWLGRHLISTPGSNSPLRAVALSSVMPDSLGGALGALAIERLTDYQVRDIAAIADLKRLYGEGDDPMAQAGRDTLAVLDKLNKVHPKDYKPDTAYSDTALARGLKETAFLIKNDMGLEVAALDMGLWDTHIAQGGATGWQATLLAELAGAIAAFTKDMGKAMSRVTLVVQTEFGRTTAENSGLGTDHGRGSVMFVAGAGVKGGKVLGKWPTLTPGDQMFRDDLPVTTDYRNVLAEVLETRLETADLAKVFPTLERKRIGVMA